MKYSFKKGLGKAVIAVILFSIPVALNILPSDFLNLTVGGLLTLLYNFAKIKYIR